MKTVSPVTIWYFLLFWEPVFCGEMHLGFHPPLWCSTQRVDDLAYTLVGTELEFLLIYWLGWTNKKDIQLKSHRAFIKDNWGLGYFCNAHEAPISVFSKHTVITLFDQTFSWCPIFACVPAFLGLNIWWSQKIAKWLLDLKKYGFETDIYWCVKTTNGIILTTRLFSPVFHWRDWRWLTQEESAPELPIAVSDYK